MVSAEISPQSRLHFIGIGGKGMSALARVYLRLGYTVTGSDLKDSKLLTELRRLGARISIGHDPENIRGADVVIYSTDIPADNPELRRVKENRGILLLHRSELLARILNNRRGIAVTGTHGKTTTSAMIAAVLMEGRKDPTVIVGEEIAELESNARLGAGPFLVAEADESDRSFLRYRPEISVVTNIEADHLEYYNGSMEEVQASYRKYLKGLKEGGTAVLSADDDRLKKMAGDCPGRVVTYGVKHPADITACEMELADGGATFRLKKEGHTLDTITLSLPGEHNVKNSLAACAVGLLLGVKLADIKSALADFRGAKRRFELVGCPQEVMIVDDYAHHPTEIRATIAAAQSKKRRIIAVFQPQRYTRTKFLMEEFSRAFSRADVVFIADIYSPSGEQAIPGVNAEVLAEKIRENEEIPVFHVSGKKVLAEKLAKTVQKDDLVLTMGAGDIWEVGHMLQEKLMSGEKASSQKKGAGTCQELDPA